VSSTPGSGSHADGASKAEDHTSVGTSSGAQADAVRARTQLVAAVDDLTDAARAIKTEGVATAKRQAPKAGAAVGAVVVLRLLGKLVRRRRSRSL